MSVIYSLRSELFLVKAASIGRGSSLPQPGCGILTKKKNSVDCSRCSFKGMPALAECSVFQALQHLVVSKTGLPSDTLIPPQQPHREQTNHGHVKLLVQQKIFVGQQIYSSQTTTGCTGVYSPQSTCQCFLLSLISPFFSSMSLSVSCTAPSC